MNNSSKNVVVILVIIIGIPAVILALIIANHKNSSKSANAPVPFQKSYTISSNQELVARSITDVDNLIVIPNKDKAKVAEIVNLKSLQAKSPIFKKAYQHDLVIFTPTETIIYDPLTKTVRDISKTSFYNDVTK